MVNLFGRWKGVCIYGPEYEEDVGQELHFTMDIQQDKDEFKGTAFDTSGLGMTPGYASIRGFIDDYTISFVKQYEISMYYDEDGREIIEEGKPGHEIIYTGTYNPADLSIEGEWEINIDHQRITDGYLDYSLTGTFWMMRA